MKNIVVAGGGVLGSQIAFQIAYSGFNVTIWLREESSIERTKPKIESVKKSYIDAVELMASENGKMPGNWCFGISDYENFDEKNCLEKIDKAYKNIVYETDLEKAVKDADLVIESVSEDVDVKKEFYKKKILFKL